MIPLLTLFSLLPLGLRKMAVDSRPSLWSITRINTHSWMGCIESQLEGDSREYRGHQWTPPTRQEVTALAALVAAKDKKDKFFGKPRFHSSTAISPLPPPHYTPTSELIASWIPLLCYWETDYLFGLGKSLSINERVWICQAAEVSACLWTGINGNNSETFWAVEMRMCACHAVCLSGCLQHLTMFTQDRSSQRSFGSGFIFLKNRFFTIWRNGHCTSLYSNYHYQMVYCDLDPRNFLFWLTASSAFTTPLCTIICISK